MARTHVVLSDETLERIDRVAGRRGRSRFLEEAARERLERLELERTIKETAGIARDHPEWRDRESVIEWVRAMRGEGGEE